VRRDGSAEQRLIWRTYADEFMNGGKYLNVARRDGSRLAARSLARPQIFRLRDLELDQADSRVSPGCKSSEISLAPPL